MFIGNATGHDVQFGHVVVRAGTEEYSDAETKLIQSYALYKQYLADKQMSESKSDPRPKAEPLVNEAALLDQGKEKAPPPPKK